MSNELPPIVYSKAFWEAASAAVAGLLGLLAFLGYVDSSWAVPAAVISTWVFALLRLFGITPELRAQLLEKQLAKAERLVNEAAAIRNDLMGFRSSKEASKPAVTKRK